MDKTFKILFGLGLLICFSLLYYNSVSNHNISNTNVSKSVELGNFGLNHYNQEIRNLQNRNEIKWDVITNKDGLILRRPYTTVVFENFSNQEKFEITDLSIIKNRFDLADQYKDKYDYGVFLLMEEIFHPSMRVSWEWSHISDWKIEGTYKVSGVELKLIKTWYIEKYGAWNQTWWDHVVASDDYNDPIVWEWSKEYYYNLIKAWHLHMKSLGKKSAIVGLVGIRESNFSNTFENTYFPSPIWEYVISNYDLIFTYRYPRSIDEISLAEDDLKLLRQKYNYKGKIAHILTTSFQDWKWNWNEKIAFEEFKRVYSYVDVIMVLSHADLGDPEYPRITYTEKLINFSKIFAI